MTSIAANVRETVLKRREGFFRPSDFPGNREAVEHALRRLESNGDLMRIRRGLYWRGASSRFGMVPPSPARVASEVADIPGTGPAGWSAAAALGVAHQVPAVETVAVPARAPTAPPRVSFVSRASRHGRREMRLRPAEVALLEVLDGWERFVEVSDDEASRRLRELIGSEAVRPAKLARAARNEPVKTRKRLKDLLASSGRPADAEAIGWIAPEAERSAAIPALAAA